VTSSEQTGEGPGLFRLWFGFLGAAVAWGLHVLTSYPLVPYACAANATWLLYLTTGVLLVVAVASGITAWGSWRELGGVREGNLFGEDTRSGFMAFFGLLSSGFFVLALLMASLPLFLVDPCAGI
jgi:hypothetical protein